jgi:hypothetical protein
MEKLKRRKINGKVVTEHLFLGKSLVKLGSLVENPFHYSWLP